MKNSKFTSLVLIISIYAIFSGLIVSIGFAGVSTPPIPFKDEGACPFECCVYREWFARKEINILRDRKKDSPVTFKIKKGDRVIALTGVVITLRPGRVKVLKPVSIGKLMADKGDIVYLLTYRGEGFLKVWFKGEIIDSVGVYGLDTNQGIFEIIESPESIWWVKVKNSKGQIGWSDRPEDFDNKDACG